MRALRVSAVLVLLPLFAAVALADSARVKVSSANVRRQASAASALLATLPKGTVVEVLGREGNWYKVRITQGDGFVLDKLMEPISLPTPEPTATPVPPPPPPPPAPPRSPGLVLDHKEVKCIVAQQFSRFDACAGPSEVSRMRLNFRAEGGTVWHFVEMKPDAKCHFGILPKPKKSTKRVEYYIDTVGSSFAEARTPEYKPIVVSRKSECKDEPMAALWNGSASVAVGGPSGAPPVPAGFETGGIVALGGAAAAATGKGLSATTIGLIGGGVGVVVVGVAVAAGGGDDNTAGNSQGQDADGDGFTVSQGDCNDNNAAVKPGGVVQFANARFDPPTTVCPDQTVNSQIRMPIVIDATNGSCSPVTINRISGTLTIVNISGQVLRYQVGQVIATGDLTPSPSTLAAGQSTTVRVEPVLACDNLCGIGSMETSGTLTIETTAGSFTVQTGGVNHTDYPLRRP